MTNIKDYSAIYFGKTCAIIKKHLPQSQVLLQFFQRRDHAVLAGITEVLSLLETHTDVSKYKARFLPEGSIIQSGEAVLELEGPYYEFGFLEGIIDGILARSTSLATNAAAVVSAANGKPVIFMGDRSDHYLNQPLDGYAIALGGVRTQVTLAQISRHDGIAIGTVPHALIQAFQGDIIKALRAYHDTFPEEKITALVDFNNDVIADSLKCLAEFGSNLNAVRVDTSEGVIDHMFSPESKEWGVTSSQIKNLRMALDQNGGQHVKIIVSSGFNAQKIALFEQQKTPVDYYGVGASLLNIKNTFTADAVKINGVECAKVGRGYNPNAKLKLWNKSI